MSQCPLVFDCGSGYIKAGYSDYYFPKHVIPSVVGRPLLVSKQNQSDHEQQLYFGDQIHKRRNQLELSYPISEGIIRNWDDMQLVWDYTFQQVGLKDQNESILVTEPIMNPLKNREKMGEILFDNFNFERVQIGIQATLSIFAEGYQSALLIDSGDGVTHTVAIVDCFVLKHQIERMNVAGRHVTNYLIRLLQQKGYNFNSYNDFEMIRELKEKVCFVSGDYEMDYNISLNTTAYDMEYTLPDGRRLNVGRERFEAPEILFDPNCAGYDMKHNGVTETAIQTYQECPIDTKKVLAQCILVSGGSSMFPGYPTRLQKDFNQILIQKFKSNQRVNVYDPPKRKYNVFIGATIQANLSSNDQTHWISKQQYEEYGPSVFRQCGHESMNL